MKLNVWIAICGVVLVAAVVVVSNLDPSTLPEALQGRWVTDEPRYEACFLDLSADFVQIGTQQGDSYSARIMEIDRDSAQASSRYAITYLDYLGETSVLVLRYDPSEGGTISMENQADILWRRENDYDI